MPIYLSFANPNPITLNIQTVAAGPNPTAVANTDYIPIAATNIIIPAGTTVFNIPVTYKGNLLPETPINPTFGVRINGIVTGQATFGRSLGIATIVSDYVLLSVGDATVRENVNGNTTASFQVFLNGPSEQTISAKLTTADGTAIAGTDYNAAVPGQSRTLCRRKPVTVVSQTVNVTILHNPASNDNPNVFTLVASNMLVGGKAPLS